MKRHFPHETNTNIVIRSPNRTYTNHQGDFAKLPIEIIKIIIYKQLNRTDRLIQRLVCRAFKSILQPHVEQTIAWFSNDENAPRPDSIPFYETCIKFMKPNLVPQQRLVKPGEPNRCPNSKHPSSFLVMNCYRSFPSWFNTEPVRSLILGSPCVPYDPIEILEFLKSHKFSSLKALILHDIPISSELLACCSKLDQLSCLCIVSCRPCYELNLSDFNCVVEFNMISSFNFGHLNTSPNVILGTLYMSKEDDMNPQELQTVDFSMSKEIKSFTITCGPLFRNRLLIHGPDQSSSNFKFNGEPGQFEYISEYNGIEFLLEEQYENQYEVFIPW